MPNTVFVDATETRVLEALSAAPFALDATQIAERASVRPAEADAALHSLAEKDIVVRIDAGRRRCFRYRVR